MRYLFVLIILIFFSVKTIDAQVIVKAKPAKPKVVLKAKDVKKPGPKYSWIDGHWKWDRKLKKYVWVKGQWVKQKHGKMWVPGHWENTPKGYKYVPGHWKKRK